MSTNDGSISREPVATLGAPELGGSGLIRLRGRFVELLVRERMFLVMLSVCFFVAGATYDTPQVAMWVGFAFAGYSAVANDSIQTIGTFIASNRDRPWWQLWLFIGAIFLATMAWSWATHDGDVSSGRLMSKGFEKAPTHFHFLHVAAPLFLMVLTRLRMPVSTTFLLLSSFATNGGSLAAMTVKSVSGYVIAFTVAFAVWFALSPAMNRWFRGVAHPAWRVGQWIATGGLWAAWLVQDAANIAVYLPRSLSPMEFTVFGGAIFLGLGLLFRMGGERIQQVVDEKSDVVDVRPATVIDTIYAAILFVFVGLSAVPMSTTWVFVGLLAGRELAMAMRRATSNGRTVPEALRLARRDLFNVAVGFIIAVILAALINPVVGAGLFH